MCRLSVRRLSQFATRTSGEDASGATPWWNLLRIIGQVWKGQESPYIVLPYLKAFGILLEPREGGTEESRNFRQRGTTLLPDISDHRCDMRTFGKTFGTAGRCRHRFQVAAERCHQSIDRKLASTVRHGKHGILCEFISMGTEGARGISVFDYGHIHMCISL